MPLTVIALVIATVIYCRRKIRQAKKHQTSVNHQRQPSKVHPVTDHNINNEDPKITNHLESKISEISFNLNPGFNKNNLKDSFRETNFPNDANHSHTSSMHVLDMTYQNLKEATLDNSKANHDAIKAQDNFSRFGMNFKYI